jgi:hypothetical protein
MTREPRTLQIRIPEPEIIPLNRWGFLALDTEMFESSFRKPFRKSLRRVIWDANDWDAEA